MGWFEKVKGLSFEGSLNTTKRLLDTYIKDFIDLRARKEAYKKLLEETHNDDVAVKLQAVTEELAHRKAVLLEASDWFKKASKRIDEVLKL